MLPRPFPAFAIAPIASLMLAGCSGSDDRATEIIAIGDPASISQGGPRWPLAAQALRAASVEGLLAFDEQGRVVPALADRWIVTDDGLSYIFRLRDGTWADGSAITADSARAALLQAIGAQRSQPLGADLGVIGEVRAMAGRVIEIRLARQAPDLLQLLAQPELGLVNAGRGAGPMKSRRGTDKELKLPGVLLKAIAPELRGLPQEENWSKRVRNLWFSAVPAGPAVKLFSDGDVSVVIGGTLVDYPRLAQAGISRSAIQFDPVSGLFGLAVLHEDGFLSLPENREAIAMALDRDALVRTFNLNGWVVTTRVLTPGLEGDAGAVSERWQGRTIEERQALANLRVQRWKAAHGGPLPLRIALPAGPGADLLFTQFAADLKAIGLNARRVALAADADLRLVDMVARYARPLWYFNQLSCAPGRPLCSITADKLVQQAAAEPDPAKRADLLAEAEARLTVENTYIPIGVPIRWSLVSSSVTGFAPNRWAIHPLMPLATVPK